MRAIVEVDSVVVGDPLSTPVSMTLKPGEIHGLLFKEGKPHQPLLRALAGIEAPIAGVVRFAGTPRIAWARCESCALERFATPPDVVLVDGLLDTMDASRREQAWARLEAERERGISILLGTFRMEQAYQADRVTLAMWNSDDLMLALFSLCERMQPLLQEVLEQLEPRPGASARPSLTELGRLTRAARHMVAEARSLARTSDERQRAAEIGAALAGVSLDERVLDSLSAQIDER